MIVPDDTIAAIATAAGGGVGIIRLSGPDAVAIATAHFTGLPEQPTARHLYHGWWRDGSGHGLDEGLAVVMPGPRSYTGEDVVELQLHGGALSLLRCLEVALQAGARLAEPGEFTRRAWASGQLDLTRAEAVADLVSARTDRALAQARQHLQGRLYTRAMGAREALLVLRSRLEVNIDFVDEDVPLIDPAALAAEALEIAGDLAALAGTWRRGQLMRDGARVVLSGRPNAGKSSLFNALCRRERAIVTSVAGTTRDTVEETLDILGVPVVLVDTAGLRESDDLVEQAGIARTRAAVEAADSAIHLLASDEEDEDAGGEAPLQRPAHATLVVRSKADLGPEAPSPGQLRVSAVSGEGLGALEEAIVDALGGQALDGGDLVIARERHRVALEGASEALIRAAHALKAGAPSELAAVDLQEASDHLGELVGLSTIEDVLDRLFAGFCIGK